MQQTPVQLESDSLFQRDFGSLIGLRSQPTVLERRHTVDVLLGMIFQILGAGSSVDGLSQFLHMLSYYLELEWDQAAKEVPGEDGSTTRSGMREECYLFLLKACSVLLMLLQISPRLPGFLESFAGACGSVEGGAAWILSAMVNSYCDKIRSIGVRCLVVYIESTSRNPDQPLALDKPLVLESENVKGSESRTIQENTLSLISNVGQGILNSNMGKGLAAIGPNVRAILLSPSKLTAGVVYKLLWHLLKSHRFRMGTWTQSSLLNMVFLKETSSITSLNFLKDHFLAVDTVFRDSVKIDMQWVDSILGDIEVGTDVSIRSSLGVSTIMRLLRFLPENFTDQWLATLVHLSSHSLSTVDALSMCPDWQPCLFQFISELIEKMATVASRNSGSPKINLNKFGDSMSTEKTSNERLRPENDKPTEQSDSDLDFLTRRLDLALQLYASLLGHRIREGGDQVRYCKRRRCMLLRLILLRVDSFV